MTEYIFININIYVVMSHLLYQTPHSRADPRREKNADNIIQKL